MRAAPEYIIVTPIPKAEQFANASGIVIPATVKRDYETNYDRGRVVAVGSHVCDVVVGDCVMFAEVIHSYGTKHARPRGFTLGGKQYVGLKAEDIMWVEV